MEQLTFWQWLVASLKMDWFTWFMTVVTLSFNFVTLRTTHQWRDLAIGARTHVATLLEQLDVQQEYLGLLGEELTKTRSRLRESQKRVRRLEDELRSVRSQNLELAMELGDRDIREARPNGD